MQVGLQGAGLERAHSHWNHCRHQDGRPYTQLCNMHACPLCDALPAWACGGALGLRVAGKMPTCHRESSSTSSFGEDAFTTLTPCSCSNSLAARQLTARARSSCDRPWQDRTVARIAPGAAGRVDRREMEGPWCSDAIVPGVLLWCACGACKPLICWPLQYQGNMSGIGTIDVRTQFQAAFTNSKQPQRCNGDGKTPNVPCT